MAANWSGKKLSSEVISLSALNCELSSCKLHDDDDDDDELHIDHQAALLACCATTAAQQPPSAHSGETANELDKFSVERLSSDQRQQVRVIIFYRQSARAVCVCLAVLLVVVVSSSLRSVGGRKTIH